MASRSELFRMYLSLFYGFITKLQYLSQWRCLQEIHLPQFPCCIRCYDVTADTTSTALQCAISSLATHQPNSLAMRFVSVPFVRLDLTFLKPTGHVTRHQCNIQQLYVLPTLYLCVLCLSENRQRLVPLTA